MKYDTSLSSLPKHNKYPFPFNFLCYFLITNHQQKNTYNGYDIYPCNAIKSYSTISNKIILSLENKKMDKEAKYIKIKLNNQIKNYNYIFMIET